MTNKVEIFRNISGWIKDENYEGKRKFVSEINGLKFLNELFCKSVNKTHGDLKKRVTNLIYDLVSNDDRIFEEDPYHVREYFYKDEMFMSVLRGFLYSVEFTKKKTYMYRLSMLQILSHLH